MSARCPSTGRACDLPCKGTRCHRVKAKCLECGREGIASTVFDGDWKCRNLDCNPPKDAGGMSAKAREHTNKLIARRGPEEKR